MKNILSMLLLCVTVILTSCRNDKLATTPVSGVTLNKQSLSLLVGGKATLVATVLPEGADDKSVTWMSSNPSAATVSDNGEVTAVSVGTATITVKSVADNTKSAACLVTVTSSVVTVTSITLNKQTLSLLVGGKATLVATVLPEGADDKSVTWTSSNTEVATVSDNGEVTAVSLGTATITVVSVADKTKNATCEVAVVKPAVEVTLVGINNKPLSLLVGENATLLVTVLPDNATDKSVTFTSNDNTVATVSQAGEVLAVGTGIATITVASVSDKTKTDQCVVTVTAPVVTTTEVGNFYYSDHSQTKIYDKTKICLGVVFWVDALDNTKGKIVSLDQVELEWSDKLESTGAINNTNGRANMYQISEFIKDSDNSAWENYPAFIWVATAKNGRLVGGWADTDMWYLPAQGELVTLWGTDGATMTAVNASLSRIPSAVALTPTIYCSSTEKNETDAIFVSFSTGFSDAIIKVSANNVRAVANF